MSTRMCGRGMWRLEVVAELSIPRQGKQHVQSPGGRRRCEVFLKLEAAQWTGALRRPQQVESRPFWGTLNFVACSKCPGKWGRHKV